MLRLCTEDRFALIVASLSMTIAAIAFPTLLFHVPAPNDNLWSRQSKDETR